MGVNLKLEMKWTNLSDKELGKVCEWLDKVPIKPIKQKRNNVVNTNK